MRLIATVYRAHNPRWSFSPESGEGARITGGRFNPAGMPALYTAMRFQTAWLEAQQGFAFKAQPMMLCACDVDCQDFLDLTAAATRRQYRIAPADLSCPWKDAAARGLEPSSWALARRLMADNIAGIMVPSFASGATDTDVNAVFWQWSRDLPHRVRVIDDNDRLPKQ